MISHPNKKEPAKSQYDRAKGESLFSNYLRFLRIILVGKSFGKLQFTLYQLGR
jgi:hypothetical protein